MWGSLSVEREVKVDASITLRYYDKVRRFSDEQYRCLTTGDRVFLRGVEIEKVVDMHTLRVCVTNFRQFVCSDDCGQVAVEQEVDEEVERLILGLKIA